MSLSDFLEGIVGAYNVVKYQFGTSCQQPMLCGIVERILEFARKGADAHVCFFGKFLDVADVAVIGHHEVLKVVVLVHDGVEEVHQLLQRIAHVQIEKQLLALDALVVQAADAFGKGFREGSEVLYNHVFTGELTEELVAVQGVVQSVHLFFEHALRVAVAYLEVVALHYADDGASIVGGCAHGFEFLG